MAFSRNSMAAAVAGTLSLAVLTGCPAQPPSGTGTPSVAPTTAPTTAPTATTAPTTAPTGQPTDGTGATAAPSAVPSASTLAPTTVQGKVYDETGALVNTGAKIMIKSLNPSNPFETNVDVVNGNYVANNVPSGVLVEITASRDGYTSRTKVENLLPLASVTAGGNQVNFGGPLVSGNGQEDPYFISKYPEVTSTEPVDETDLADPTQLTYKLTLSEALDATNQRRFAQAIRIWPNNTAAAGTTAPVGGVGGNNGVAGLTIESAAGDTPAAATYSVQEGSSFNSDSNLATVTWDAAGKVATLTFKAPLKASSASKANYIVGLVSAGAGERIVDGNGDQLGANGNLTTYPGAGLIADAFKKATLPTLSFGTGVGAVVASDLNRLAATHNSVVRFNVAEDDTAPVFQSVAVTGGNVITLTFSEPLVAFGGTGTPISNGALNPANYRIRLAEKLDDLSTEKMDGAATPATATFALMQRDVTYVLDATNYEVKVSETDPKSLLLRRKDFTTNAGDKFPVTAKAIRVRVMTGGETGAPVGAGVQDTAGNKVQSSNDANLKSTNI